MSGCDPARSRGSPTGQLKVEPEPEAPIPKRTDGTFVRNRRRTTYPQPGPVRPRTENAQGPPRQSLKRALVQKVFLVGVSGCGDQMLTPTSDDKPRKARNVIGTRA